MSIAILGGTINDDHRLVVKLPSRPNVGSSSDRESRPLKSEPLFGTEK